MDSRFRGNDGVGVREACLPAYCLQGQTLQKWSNDSRTPIDPFPFCLAYTKAGSADHFTLIRG